MNVACFVIIIISAAFAVITKKQKRAPVYQMENFEESNFEVPHIKLRYSEAKGSRGIFADRDFKEGDVIEYAPFVELDKATTTCLGVLGDYVFAHSLNPEKTNVALGYLSLYNHDDNHNVEYLFDDPNKWYVVKALRDIKRGEELCNSYGSIRWEDRPHITKK